MPSGIGMRVTHGCVRMFPWDIEALYKVVPIGTPVTIVNQPYKLGWTEQGLYLEAIAARERRAEIDGRAEPHRHGRGRRTARRIVDRAYARLRRGD